MAESAFEWQRHAAREISVFSRRIPRYPNEDHEPRKHVTFFVHDDNTKADSLEVALRQQV
jgi:hypothetical protein